MKKILLVAVDYNSNEFTKQLLTSIEGIENSEKFEVNIAFTGKAKLELRKPHSHYYFENLGYFRAVNRILQEKKLNQYDSIIVCNNDIQILSNDLYTRVLGHINDFDVIAPTIINSNNYNQNPHRIYPPKTSTLLKYRVYFSSFMLGKIIFYLRSLKKPISRNLKSRQIFSPHGAFIIFKSTYFEKGGFIDTNFFLYGEEDSVAGICKTLGMKIFYDSEIFIRHFASVSTGNGLSKFKWLEQKKAHIYITRNYVDFKLF